MRYNQEAGQPEKQRHFLNKIMEKKIALPLKAKHFKGTDYGDICDCAISKAAKEYFGVEDVREGVFDLSVGKYIYDHQIYTSQAFRSDKNIAERFDPEEVVTIIILTKRD